MNDRGEHIHHGYFLRPEDTKEAAQLQLIELLLERSGLSKGTTVLDVGCGIGGTARYLAREYGCSVTGITISGTQVQMARSFTAKENGRRVPADTEEYNTLGHGKVRFWELDAEKMGDYFHKAHSDIRFDAVWISEAMSHLPDKKLFFRNAFSVLNDGGKLIIADWFKAEQLSSAELKADIQPIEGGRFPEAIDWMLVLTLSQMACCFLHCARNPIMSNLQSELASISSLNHST